MNKTIPILVAIALLSLPTTARGETVSPESWVYDALRSFEIRGLVALEPTLPYTFDQCEAYVREIVAHVETSGVSLGPRHRFLLGRLAEEFIGTRGRPENREDRPFAVYRDGERWAAFDLSLGGTFRKKVDEEKGEGDGLVVPGILVDLGRRLTMESSYRLVMAPERGLNDRNSKPGARTKSYRGLTGELTRALAAMNGDWWQVRAGREYLQWGSARSEGLILSRTAGSFDHVGARIELGRFALSAFQASLDPQVRRHLAGHRLTVALPRRIFVGVSETALYMRDFDFAYFMPLSFFYAQQFSERGNADNILWSLDWKVPLRRGLILHGEFLIDDIMYERDEISGPDRVGVNISADASFLVGGRNLELSGSYTYVDIYTYAHGSGTAYIAGDGRDPRDPLIGSLLGPDADRWLVRAALGVGERAEISLEGAAMRWGEGSLAGAYYLEDWRPGMDNDPDFPSGDLLCEKTASLGFLYDLKRGSYISAEGGVRLLSGGPQDIDTEDGFGRLDLYLDLR